MSGVVLLAYIGQNRRSQLLHASSSVGPSTKPPASISSTNAQIIQGLAELGTTQSPYIHIESTNIFFLCSVYFHACSSVDLAAFNRFGFGLMGLLMTEFLACTFLFYPMENSI